MKAMRPTIKVIYWTMKRIMEKWLRSFRAGSLGLSTQDMHR